MVDVARLRGTGWKAGLGRLALLLAGGLLLGEFAVRLWERSHEPTGSLYNAVVLTGLRFKLRPGATVLVPEKHGAIRYSFNRAGYRDRNHDPHRPGRRLVILGDSVSFGLGVEQNQIYPALLERHLSHRLRRPYEVVNLAVFAYDTRHELEAFRDDGLALAPTTTVLQFYMNDFSIAGDSRPVFSLVAAFRTLKNRYFFHSALYRRWYPVARGAADRFARTRRQPSPPSAVAAAEPEIMLRYLASYPDDLSVAAFRAVREIHAEATRGGSRFLLFVSPDQAQLSTAKYDGIDRRIHRFCRANGISFFDPLPALRARPDRARLFYDQSHLSPLGHEVVAALLADELVARRMVR